MDNFTKPISEAGNELKRYINLKIAYAGLQLNRRLSDFASQLVTMLVLAGIFAMILLMLSFAFVFWYGSEIGTYYHGFLIISLLYMIFGLIIYYFREPLLMDPIIRKLHQKQQKMEPTGDSTLLPVRNKEEMDKQLDIMELQLEQSELLIQKHVQDIGTALTPSNILNSLFTYALSSSSLMMNGALLLLRLLKKRKP
ncbi:MAG: hypothetical protein RBR84_06375 [Bacteroidales bacterium]|jgi:hypothetical protein|nr:hypothetical protein [Bacteroidales bacterium]MDD4087085.1 hypothetical protein [Bacteroidales bacterium]MDY0085525.1 hypothetical protein [Bacteroidales bacterium]